VSQDIQREVPDNQQRAGDITYNVYSYRTNASSLICTKVHYMIYILMPQQQALLINMTMAISI